MKYYDTATVKCSILRKAGKSRIMHLWRKGWSAVFPRLPSALQNVIIRTLLRRYWDLQEIIVEMASRTGDGVYVKRKYPWGLQRYFNDHISISDVVLDLGCGNGELTQMLAEKAKRVVACDRLPSDVKTAQNHHGKDNITYICVDIASYLPAGDYDVAVLSAVLSLVTDPVDLLKRLHAATAKLLIRETKYDYHVMPLLAREFGVPGTYYKLYQKHELMALLDNTGWQVVEEWDSYDLFLSCEAVNG